MTYPFESWARTHMEVHSSNGEEWLITCPNPEHPDRNPSCYFNVVKGTWWCFSCGNKGGVNAEGSNDKDLLADLILHNVKDTLQKRETVESEQTVPESTLGRYNFPTPYWTEERHLNQGIIDKFQLGYDIFSNAATIPERTPQGGLIGVTRRFLDTTGNDRYRYPKGFKKSHNLFGSWLDDDYSEVAVTEGAIDAMKVWQVGLPTLGIYGALTSTFHIQVMKQIGVRKIIWIGDNDRAGRSGLMRSRGYIEQVGGKFKYKSELDMSKHFLLYHVTEFHGKKDTGSMTDQEVLKTIESQELFVPDITVDYIKTQHARMRGL